MRIPDPWKCDGCGTIKQESNNWLIIVFFHAQNSVKAAINISQWNEEQANNPSVKHVCGHECAVVQITKLLPELLK